MKMSSVDLLTELKANFNGFETQWPNDLTKVINALNSERLQFETSYIRISSIQAWRTSVIAEFMDEDCASFFFEAQNDLLVSHCLARCGSFRQALKALRSSIENIFFSLFYMSHSVELIKWTQGKHKAGFTELFNYFESHPTIEPFGLEKTGLTTLKSEYSTLSKAVHASAKQFRMTSDLIDTKLWVNDATSVSKWSSREGKVIVAINLLLLHLFSEFLKGARHPGLRKTIGLTIPKAKHSIIKNDLGVNLL
jgi:hypothetical protein